MAVLREFLYRHDDLVSQFLEQLEGGVYDEEEITETTGSASGLGGSVGASGAKLAGERRKHGDRQAARTVRQTASSRFNRLHSLLEEEDLIQPLEALDDAIWDQIARNEILEVEAEFTLAPGVAEMNAATALGGAGPLLDLMKSLPDEFLPDNFDRSEAERMSGQLPVMQGFADHFATAAVPCTFSPGGSPRYRFFAEILREHLLCNLDELQGNISVLAKVQRLIPKGKPETLGGGMFPAMSRNRQERRRAKSEQPMTIRLSHPAAVVTVIGIYR